MKLFERERDREEKEEVVPLTARNTVHAGERAHDRRGARVGERPAEDSEVVVIEVGVADRALEVKAVHARRVAVEERRGGPTADGIAAARRRDLATGAALHVVACRSAKTDYQPLLSGLIDYQA
jgi:hypothetical protein